MERLADLLKLLSRDSLSQREREDAVNALRAEISALWLTDRARADKLTVTDEVRTGLYFVDSFFWNTIPIIYRDLEKALEQNYPGLTAPHAWLKLASWIGGGSDRQSHVTFGITAETLRLHPGLSGENDRRSF